jgi:peptide/nickel transport system permease protein
LTNSSSERKEHSFLINLLIRFVKEKPLGTVGGIITLLLLFTGIFADFIAPYGMNEAHSGYFLASPSKIHWLGTDNLGRDILSRVIYGARISVIIGLTASAGATLLSVIIGTLSGYYGGKFDLIMQRIVDAWMCFPGLILLMVLMSVIGIGTVQIIIVLSLRWGFSGSRIIRGAVMSLKENVYIQAGVAIGCSTNRILIRHILPNLMAPTIILFTTRVPDIIITEAALSFLGFGIPPPTPTWGGMLSGSARQYMLRAPWIVIWPGLALSTVVYGINMFGDALRDLLDPKLIGGAGRYGIKAKGFAKKIARLPQATPNN